MHFSIIGFLPDGNEDEFVKYEMNIPLELEGTLLAMMGHSSLGEMAGCDWPLTPNQTERISSMIEQSLPHGLDFYIYVAA